MPFSHRPLKTARSIRRKKGPQSTSSLHASSRDAAKLTRSTLRDEKLTQRQKLRGRREDKCVSRVAYFRALISDPTSPNPSPGLDPNSSSGPDAGTQDQDQYPPAALTSLIHRYISRTTSTLSTLHPTPNSTSTSPTPTITPSHLPYRAPSARESALKQVLADETAEFESGFWMPDVRTPEGRKDLVERWDGGWVGLGQLGFIRVTRAGEVGGSRWPPNWGS